MDSVRTDRKATLYGRNGQAEARLVVLSTQGVGVHSNRGARIGTELEVEFELPALERFLTLKLTGKVTDRHNAGDKVHLHIQFNHLDEHSKEAIQDFINYKERLSKMSVRATS